MREAGLLRLDPAARPADPQSREEQREWAGIGTAGADL